MEKENILLGGIEELYTMKENLLELEGYKERSLSWGLKENQTEKKVSMKEKEITDKIAATIKKRKSEIEVSYDEQIDKIKTNIKKEKSRKLKEKTAQVSERIKEETSELAKERVRLKEEMKSVYEKDHIPRVFNNSLYHALFLPRNFHDICVIILTIIITLVVVPIVVYKLWLPAKGAYLAIAYILTVIFFGGIYLLINTKTKESHGNAMIDIRAIRTKLARNQKKIDVIAKDIRKDKDESTYSLDDFDKEIEQLNMDLKEVSETKKEALIDFETETKTLIDKEIRSQNSNDLEQLKKELEQASSEKKKADEKVRLFSMEVSKKYEALLGKEMMVSGKVDLLIEIMQSGQADTVAKALKVYHEQNMNQPAVTQLNNEKTI